ncbi:MAG: dihydroorotate dehydrogenase-like protein [Alphaproteobacteria bacterium]|nr:dihydroorotate dehydrogenase-like protein [Alphaproteobacteria bacterium]
MDLSTRYMGLDLKHPLVASASPLSADLDGIRRLEDGGAAAIVMFSLFEEQLREELAALDHLTTTPAESFAESLTYFPEVDDYHVGPGRYLELVRRGVEAVDIPVIASLNCISSEGWSEYAKQLCEAGAAGLELNVYYLPADPDMDGRAVEQRYLDALAAVKAVATVPVALKLSPFFSAVANMLQQLAAGGADALVLFNRFYQPDFDLETLTVVPALKLSDPVEMRLPLRWIAMLHGRIEASLAATTGVSGPEQAVKYLLAGADAVMTTSALLRNGPDHLQTLVQGLADWMDDRGFESVERMKGVLSQQTTADPTAFARANYIRTLESWKHPYTLSGV